MKREKQNRIENKRGYDLVKCYFIILSALNGGVSVCLCVCSFLMPAKCQQNKSLRRLFEIFVVSFFLLFSLSTLLSAHFRPHRTHLWQMGRTRADKTIYMLYETMFFISMGRWECARCACECIFVSIYQLDFGELLKHFLFINYGWYDLLRTICCTTSHEHGVVYTAKSERRPIDRVPFFFRSFFAQMPINLNCQIQINCSTCLLPVCERRNWPTCHGHRDWQTGNANLYHFQFTHRSLASHLNTYKVKQW